MSTRYNTAKVVFAVGLFAFAATPHIAVTHAQDGPSQDDVYLGPVYCPQQLYSADIWFLSNNDITVRGRVFEVNRYNRVGVANYTNWYEPYPIAPVDKTGEWRWIDGSVRLACEGWRIQIGGLNVQVTKGRIVDAIRGEVVPVSGGDGGGGCDTTQIEYDPYSDEEDCDSDSNNNTSGGTPYEVGDYTGGEQIDFYSGTGTGVPSECGYDAVVDHICIDVWDGSAWVEWACGYATTC